MSNETKSPSETEKDDSGGKIRKILLFGILGVLIICLAFDYLVARAGVDAAYDKIVALNEKTNASRTDALTKEAVQQAIGRAPTDSYNDGTDFVEEYSWQSGLPTRTYKLYAIYKPQGDSHIFYRHSKYVYDAAKDVIPIPDLTEVEADDELPEGYDESGGGGPGGGGPGGGGPGGGGGSRPSSGTTDSRGPDPLETFANDDKNNDNVLTGDEIPHVVKENLADIDLDGDGGVSLDEFKQRLEYLAGVSGGGRPGGGGPGGGFDPEARFAESDADDDGVLKGDEITGRMKDGLSEIDTDGDGAISKDEFMQRVAQMRARFAGGQDGDGGGRGARGRPELETESEEAPTDPDVPAAQEKAADDPDAAE